MHLCTWSEIEVKVSFFPCFDPNDYLFETHKTKGKDDPEIFAWAIRDFLLKNSHLQPCTQTLEEKSQYRAYLEGKSISYNKQK